MLRPNSSALFKNWFTANFFVVKYFITGTFFLIISVKPKEGLTFKSILLSSEM